MRTFETILSFVMATLLAGCAMFNEAPSKPQTYDPDELVEFCEGSGPMKRCYMIPKERAEQILESYIDSIRAF